MWNAGAPKKLTTGYKYRGKALKSDPLRTPIPRRSSSRAEKQTQLRNVLKESKLKRRSTFTFQNVGHESLVDTIVVPEGFEAYEWLCANTVDFVDEVYILYLYCKEDYASKFQGVSEGFPDGMLYTWEGNVVSGPEYLDSLFKWFLERIEDTKFFVVDEKQTWPDDFKDQISKMHTRILRIFCILYHCEYEHLSQDEGKLIHLKAELKHFIFFACYWELINFDGPDVLPLKKHIDKIASQYDLELKEWEQKTLKRFRVQAMKSREAFFAKTKDSKAYTTTTTDMELHSTEDAGDDDEMI